MRQTVRDVPCSVVLASITRSRFAALTLLLLASLVGQAWADESGDAGAVIPPHIVNGTPTQERPTTGALLRAESGTLVGICSGTLIGCQHFVTAAHCVCAGDDFASCGSPDPTQHRVYLQHAGILNVSAIAVNPAFVFRTAGDVAVLRLSSPVTGIRPSPINAIGDPGIGMSGIVAGFGSTGIANADFGLLRHGSVVLAGCGATASAPEHVCWRSEEFVTPGVDANTCFGDSGGPLFLDFGSGDVLAGVTSGGQSIDCLPPDVSFQASVFRNRTFIQSIGGADLASTACGSLTQVGDVGTQVTTVLFDDWGTTRRCRKEVTRRYAAYMTTKLKLMQKCLDLVNKGTLAGPCPDAAVWNQIERARARVTPAKIAKWCSPAVIPGILAAGRCGAAVTPTDLAGCIIEAGDWAVASMLDIEYANANPWQPIADTAALACQANVARAMGRYGIQRLQSLVRCQTAEDNGRVAACPDPRTLKKLSRLTRSAQGTIERRCTDAIVKNLDASDTFGGGCAGVSSAAALAACEIGGHDFATDSVVALLQRLQARRRASVIVPTGTTRLRVTLNGIDKGSNDLDLFAMHGSPPTTDLFHASSRNGGVYEGIESSQPAPGTWHVLVDQKDGANIPFQLTISTFQP